MSWLEQTVKNLHWWETFQLPSVYKVVCIDRCLAETFEGSHWCKALQLPSVWRVVFLCANFAFTTSHLRVRTKAKPFVCAMCTKTFRLNRDLQRHLKVHAGEKPYSCAQSRKSFWQSVVLQKHFLFWKNKRYWLVTKVKLDFLTIGHKLLKNVVSCCSGGVKNAGKENLFFQYCWTRATSSKSLSIFLYSWLFFKNLQKASIFI